MELIARPRRLRIAAAIAALVVVAAFIVATALLSKRTEGGGTFQRGDQVALLILGALIAAGLLLFTRPLVGVDGDTVVVRNFLASRRLPLAVVVGVRFADGSPWATLELADDEQVSLLAIQAADKQRAVQAVDRLRTVVQAGVSGRT